MITITPELLPHRLERTVVIQAGRLDGDGKIDSVTGFWSRNR
jgi:hypothetical protein